MKWLFGISALMLMMLQSNNPMMLTVDLVLFCVLSCLMLYSLSMFQFFSFLFCMVYISGFLIILCYISSFIPGKSYSSNNMFDVMLFSLIFMSLSMSFKSYNLFSMMETNYSLHFTYYIMFLIVVMTMVLIMLSILLANTLHPIRLL